MLKVNVGLSRKLSKDYNSTSLRWTAYVMRRRERCYSMFCRARA